MYRDELTAAHNRAEALERELQDAEERIAELEASSGGLRGLLKRGRREKERARRARQRAEARKERAERKRSVRTARYERWASARRRVRSSAPTGWMAHWIFPLAPVGIAIPMAAIFIIFSGARAFLAGLMTVVLALWAVANLWGWWQSRREQDRVGSLPFPIRDHLQILGAKFATPQVHILFADAVPSHQKMQSLLLGLSSKCWSPTLRQALARTRIHKVEGDTLVLSSEEIATRWASANRSYLLWYRQVVEVGARALTTEYPIQSLRVDSAS